MTLTWPWSRRAPADAVKSGISEHLDEGDARLVLPGEEHLV